MFSATKKLSETQDFFSTPNLFISSYKNVLYNVTHDIEKKEDRYRQNNFCLFYPFFTTNDLIYYYNISRIWLR
ncbi:hypothetical protein GT2_21_00630 [Parageobacillus thermoglucosidasius NBRC 107763]|nr:hypothetical protein GT2_21_00630 [Parageobacillus thermoglucosidasius NBRC 107763]